MPCRGRISGPSSPTKCTQTDSGTKRMELVCCSGLQDGSNRTVVMVVTSLWSLLPLVVLLCFGLVSHADGYRGIVRLKEHPEIPSFERFSLPSVQQCRPSGIWSRVIWWIDRYILEEPDTSLQVWRQVQKSYSGVHKPLFCYYSQRYLKVKRTFEENNIYLSMIYLLHVSAHTGPILWSADWSIFLKSVLF
jgi:hypothetical protein